MELEESAMRVIAFRGTARGFEKVSPGFYAGCLTMRENESDLPGAGASSPSRFRPLPPPYRAKSTMSGAPMFFLIGAGDKWKSHSSCGTGTGFLIRRSYCAG